MRRGRQRRGADKKPKAGSLDRGLLGLVVFLTVLGLVAVADASSPQALKVFEDPFYFLKQQLMWGALGLLGMIVASCVPYRLWRKGAVVAYGVGLVLLIMVLVPGVGMKVMGARRWISVGGVNFQPAEAVKLALIVMVAYLLDSERPLWQAIAAAGLVVGLIMLQPDFGTTIVVAGIVMAQLFVAGVPILYFLGLVALGGVGAALMVVASDYRRARLMTFLESTVDPLGSSYHIRQILIALGSGGILGMGLGQSRQKHLFLPETATDSVFAVIAEEVGFVGAALVVVLLTVFALRLLRLASRVEDRFAKLLIVGIWAWVGGQAFLNLASMVALTPLTGIPLPFFSYGGSSLTALLVAMGIVLNVSRHVGMEGEPVIKLRRR